MCREKTLEEAKSEYNKLRKECCPGVDRLEFVERDSNVQKLFGTYPISMPSTKEILLETIGTNVRHDVNTVKDIIEMLTDEEIDKNLVEPSKWKAVMEHVADLCKRENREVFVKRSNKFSNLLNCELIALDYLREKLLALFNGRSTDAQKDLHLEISGSPEAIVYMSTDAKFSSCQDWKSNTDLGCTSHNASHRVWANLEDPTMCVAVLKDKEGNKYARSNLRVLHYEGVNYVYIQRIYAISPHNLIMKQTLNDLVLPADYVPVPLFDGNKDCVGPMILYPTKFTLASYEIISCEDCDQTGTEEVDCNTCNGAGDVKITCEECNGEKSIEVDCRHCDGDDKNCYYCSGTAKVTDDCSTCRGEGSYEERCEECVGGKVEQKCSSCKGEAFRESNEYGEVLIPYSDHEEIMFDAESIMFMLPERQ